MAKQDYTSGSGNRNLPSIEPEHKMPFTNSNSSTNRDESLAKTDSLLADIDKTLGDMTPSETLNALADEDLTKNGNVGQDIQEFHEKNLGISSGGPTSPSGKPKAKPASSTGVPKKGEASTSGNSPRTSAGGNSSEKETLKDILKKDNENYLDSIRAKQQKVGQEKTSRFNIRGRARKRVRLLALGAVFAVAAAVPIGILGVIPHALQGWVQNKVSAYTEHAVDKMGQRVLFTFFRDRVAIEKCKGAYSAAGNTLGVNACRPRLNERDSRLSQLFNDWHSANMEQKLIDKGINVEYDPAELGRGGKPYKITIDGVNFSAAEDFGSADWDISTFTGKRETSLALRKEMKAVLKEDTKWFQYLKRRNMKAGYLRDLGLPARVFPSKKVAKTLDDIDVAKLKGVSEFRQYLTKLVVSKGDARVGALLEILLSGESSKGAPSEIRKTNKALAAAAEKLGAKDVEKLLEKFAGKNLQEIEIQLIKDLIAKFSEKIAEKFGQVALDAIPVIGWVLFALTVLDALDLATDGTLQHWISSQNVAGMMDVANLMDTTVSEEKRGYVDAQSAGDMRLSLINGLGSSRVFANMVGYKSPSGKQPAGYDCKPSVSVKDMSSILGATGEIFGDGDPTALKQSGMAPDQQTCENHRVDYDPLNALSPLFALAQNGVAGVGGLHTYTDDCVASLVIPGAGNLPQPPHIPGFPDCPSLQQVYHGAQGGISWIFDHVGISKLSEFIGELPPIKWLMSTVTGWMSNGVSVLITGQSLAGPELLQGGLKSESKSGARLVDSWVGGGESQQFAFAKGVGDGGGLGGVPLTPNQAATLDSTIADERREELADSSFFDRMFDITHTDTLASSAMAMAVTEGGFGNFINPMNNIAMVLNGSSHNAFAEDGEDKQGLCGYRNGKGQAVTEFGVVCYGVPDEYIDSLTDDQVQDLADPDKCDVQTSGIDAKRKESEDGTDESKKDPDGTGTSTEIDGCRLLCTVTDTMGTNFRKDDKICGFENLDDTSSQTTSSGETPTGEISEDSFDTPCYPGTTDLGERTDAYSKGQRLRIRLCALPNMPCSNTECVQLGGGKALVSSVFSEGWFNLVSAAQAESIPMSATSSWRTMEHQQQLCNGNAKCRSGDHSAVAEPGYSNHQAGAAIDLDNASFGGAASGRTCENAQTTNTNTYEWMRKNAKRFGIGQYANESWHWGGVESCRF